VLNDVFGVLPFFSLEIQLKMARKYTALTGKNQQILKHTKQYLHIAN
jgi:hypothetical protein